MFFIRICICKCPYVPKYNLCILYNIIYIFVFWAFLLLIFSVSLFHRFQLSSYKLNFGVGRDHYEDPLLVRLSRTNNYRVFSSKWDINLLPTWLRDCWTREGRKIAVSKTEGLSENSLFWARQCHWSHELSSCNYCCTG